MNDIERLAAAIKKKRLTSVNATPQEVSDEKLLSNGGVHHDLGAESQQEEIALDNYTDRPAEAFSSSLEQDIASDFGLSSITARPVESFNQVPFTNEISEPRSPSTNHHAPLIEIPIEKLARKGFITPITPRGLMTEQYRRIKRPLLKNLDGANSDGVNSNVIMVTSSVSGEGKTFSAINLAMSLAQERDRTVLLIDADVLKNTASSIFDVEKDKLGLTDLLAGAVQDPAKIILRTNITNLAYIPSGSLKQNTNELLSSVGMRRLFDELASRYHDRIIVLDCPPLLQTNEASVITDYAGQIVFVVAEEDTSQSFVSEALTNIPDDRFVGVILNKSRRRFLGGDYGYNYDYG